jgi:hypothetical protein
LLKRNVWKEKEANNTVIKPQGSSFNKQKQAQRGAGGFLKSF